MAQADANARLIQNSLEDVWFLKSIKFDSRETKIITQNYNGPCSLIAICNILILRGDVEILPPDRTSVSYEFLSQLVGEYLLRASPDIDISAALSILPLTQKGMDLNPLFTGATSFRPAGDGGALKLFEQANIKLYHGWLVDPESPEYSVLAATEDYDNSVNVIVAADDLTKGQLVVEQDTPGPSHAGPSHISERWTPDERRKIEDALVIRGFLDATGSQLTYHGLFALAASLEPGALVALFRNSHLAVLHRPSTPDGAGALFTLVTDAVFAIEPAVVWERLEDVDGGSAAFVDADFVRASPAGGDFAGHTAESALAAFEIEAGIYANVDPADRELARQLQAEEDANAQQLYAGQVYAERDRRRQQLQQSQREAQEKSDYRTTKKKRDCAIM